MDDLIAWMQEGGQVGIFYATNSTRKRRNMLMKMAEGKWKIIFLETICNDERIIERNIRLKIQQSPDYVEETDFEAGYQDFKKRVENYEKVYEPVEEGSYIKMIDMVSGQGGQIQVNNICGCLPGRIVFFLEASVIRKYQKSYYHNDWTKFPVYFLCCTKLVGLKLFGVELSAGMVSGCWSGEFAAVCCDEVWW